ncbi:hypothetical protein CO661_02060 [Sinorhizobium fredii]|uniref:Asl1-like glycosyl hydrolase catalytic domain-containing protein n=2 Tax=Rhizobium fredii TaxID=380 RepID=A0A2A6M7D6_RHIFR|nr:hypothetical protein CO661_02060 [Sinorhizobium fredii]
MSNLRSLFNPSAVAVGLLSMAGASMAEDVSTLGMRLGAVTHFSQGWNLSLVPEAKELGVHSVRDSIAWRLVEPAKHQYNFENPRVSYVARVAAAEVSLVLVVNSFNPNYDEGLTPYTSEGREALANFVLETLNRFPEIKTVEIGNEFNGKNFVKGPVREAPYSERDDYYFEILRTVYERVKPARPDVSVLGGATHSVPVDYLSEMFSLGALDFMDGVAIHPYTSTAEDLGAQLAMLRKAMGDKQRDIYITEFGTGSPQPGVVPAYMLKFVSVMSAHKVKAAYWYALMRQKWFPDMELVDQHGRPSTAGEAFRFIQEQLLANGDGVDVSPDDFSYAFQFGQHAMVLWGEPRQVKFMVPVEVYDATGTPVPTFSGRLDPDRPVIIKSGEALIMGETVQLAPTDLVGDSYHQFHLPGSVDAGKDLAGKWSYFARGTSGEPRKLSVIGGGQRNNEPWIPYVGVPRLRPLMITSEGVNPAAFGKEGDRRREWSTVERFTVPADMTVRIVGEWNVSDKSEDGAALTVLHNGAELHSGPIGDKSNKYELKLDLDNVAVKAGDQIDFIVGVGSTARGRHLTNRRIQIFRR